VKLVLLHSPLVGPSTWAALTPILRARGHAVAVPDLTPILRGDGPYYDALATVAAAAVGEDNILVVHSGAGALVPSVALRVPLRGAIFVDALLPHPAESWFAGVPEPLGARLRGLTKDGRLPPWHAWWPKGAMEALLPDRRLGAAFVAEQGEVPLAYLDGVAPAIPLMTPSAYLQLSAAYQEDADVFATKGWPVARLDLHHLAMLTHPDEVAPAIEQLAATL
jgi:hypothetical protein